MGVALFDPDELERLSEPRAAKRLKCTSTAAYVMGCVAVEFGTTISQILSKDRHKTLADARRCVYWLLRQQGYSFPEIGDAVGCRDHTSAMYGVRSAEKKMLEEPWFRARVLRVMRGADDGPIWADIPLENQ